MIQFLAAPGVTGTGSLSLALPIVNTAWLTDMMSGYSVAARVMVNGYRAYFPILLHEQ
jgi:hypothetical protein